MESYYLDIFELDILCVYLRGSLMSANFNVSSSQETPCLFLALRFKKLDGRFSKIYRHRNNFSQLHFVQRKVGALV